MTIEILNDTMVEGDFPTLTCANHGHDVEFAQLLMKNKEVLLIPERLAKGHGTGRVWAYLIFRVKYWICNVEKYFANGHGWKTTFRDPHKSGLFHSSIFWKVLRSVLTDFCGPIYKYFEK